MEKTVFTEVPVADPKVAEPTPTERFQAQVAQLGQLLVRQVQARGGQLDILSMELRLRILQEHLQLLSELLITAHPGLTDELITRMMCARMDNAIALLDQEIKAPLLARPTMNGKSH